MRNCARTGDAWRRRATRLSLSLYVDDCAYSKLLRQTLQTPPHRHAVAIPEEVGLRGAPDPEHFAYHRAHGMILVTTNPDDLEALHRQQPDHSGIFAIYQDNDPRDMAQAEIAQAITNIIAAEVPLAGTFHTLNRWRY